MRKLTVDDIVDHRAYERERDEFRAAIIAMKKRRRIALGDLVTIVFENTDTMRFQVQEMARAERMLTDDAIAGEVATYNELIPDPGELSGTLFIELTDDELLREWLPKLREIEFDVRFELGTARRSGRRSSAIPRDEERLTRDDITSTVHYLRFPFDAEQRELLATGPARLVVDHPEYQVVGGAHRRAAGRARRRLRRLMPVRIKVQRLDPELPAPAPAAHRRCRLRPPRPRAGRARAGRGTRRSCPPGSRSRSRPGYAGFVLPRSGLALKHGITCLNTPGLIDPLYRGELKVLLVNTDPTTPFTVERGDRIAQLVIQHVEQVDWKEVDELDATERDTFGFGSTGV